MVIFHPERMVGLGSSSRALWWPQWIWMIYGGVWRLGEALVTFMWDSPNDELSKRLPMNRGLLMIINDY
jgi:hypothetical protein